MDEDYEKCENKLASTTEKLDNTNRDLDESGRMRRVMENRAASDKIRFKELEKIVKELTTRTEEAEMKIEETVQIIAIFEEDLETAEMKAHNSELLFFKYFIKYFLLRFLGNIFTLVIFYDWFVGKYLHFKKKYKLWGII